MFNQKEKTIQENNLQTGNTLIAPGTIITGDIVSNVDVRIDGILKGNISGSAKILLGKDGLVEGNIEGRQADIMGTVRGKLMIKELLSLRGNATVNGDIVAGKLEIESTVTFNGKCQMGENNVVEMNKEDQKHAIAQ
ncbi:MAG: polymer-forming cytoskeletal protein [Sphingobacteriales bacterium]|jgi:cytoskeletal protein CcmA (bactofilin family)